MIPWVMWIAGIAGYLILVCEAMVAVPLWMLAHLTFEGDGLHRRGFAGYELLFNILFRPVLMLIGLFLGYFIFTCISWLIRMSFGIAAAFVLGDGWLVTNWLGLFVLLSIFVLTHVVAAIASFPHDHADPAPHSAHDRLLVGEPGRHGRVFARGRACSARRKRLRQFQTAWAEAVGRPAAVRAEGQNGPEMLGSRESGHTRPMVGEAGNQSVMDTTVQATTAMGGGMERAGGRVMSGVLGYALGYDAGCRTQRAHAKRVRLLTGFIYGQRLVQVDQSYIDRLHRC